MEEVVGFTANQRQWFLERDGNRCMFHYFDLKTLRWKRCDQTTDLQVHHIIPRGWAKHHMPPNFQLNGSMNGITLCKCHHVGSDSVHPDTYQANVSYRKGNKKAYEVMMTNRKKMNQQGIPYWNTRWDWMFNRLVRKATLKFIRKNPYPANGNRGNTGRRPHEAEAVH